MRPSAHRPQRTQQIRKERSGVVVSHKTWPRGPTTVRATDIHKDWSPWVPHVVALHVGSESIASQRGTSGSRALGPRCGQTSARWMARLEMGS